MIQKLVSVNFFLLAMLFILPANAALFSKDDPDKAREAAQEMREKVLARLYDEVPDTKQRIANAVGYAVFDNRGWNLLILSTAIGKGIAHDNSSSKDIYMNMYSVGGGIGMGIKSFDCVFIFHTRKAFDNFVENGWDFSAQVDAAATTDSQNDDRLGSAEMAINLNQEVEIFQMTDKGLALQATLQGTKYWKNKDLN